MPWKMLLQAQPQELSMAPGSRLRWELRPRRAQPPVNNQNEQLAQINSPE